MKKPDCLKCGACCVAPYDQPGFAEVSAKDETKLGRKFVRLHVVRAQPITQLAAAMRGDMLPNGIIATKRRLQRSGPLKGCELCTCVALRGTVLQKVHCSVYENRPEVCRKALKPGDRTCLAIRRAFKEYQEDGRGTEG